jgi:hypothetical protein
MPNYQPFLISEFKTGLFNYLQPWIRPNEAFEPLNNAYVYRGGLYKRNGYQPWAIGTPTGTLSIGTGDGITLQFTGTLTALPIQDGSFTATDGVETIIDNGDGTLESGLGGNGFINYSTGAYTINFATAPALAAPITASYSISNSHLTYQDFLQTGNGTAGPYNGALLVFPIVPGTFNPFNGVESFTDNGQGVLTGSLGGTGTIVYSTGVYSITFNTSFVAGVNIYANYSPASNISRPIMGIMQWTNESTDMANLVVADTRRASLFVDNTDSFVPLNTISQTYTVQNGSTAPFTFNLGFTAVFPYTNALTPYTVTVSYPGGSMTDNGSGGFTGVSPGNMKPATSTVNYTTGVIVVNFTVVPPPPPPPVPAGTVFTVTATLAGDYFTGDFSNFFNWVNWQGSLYFTNNVDPITAFNGTNIYRPPFSITQADYNSFTNDIATCLELDVYKNRFLVQRPTLTTAATPVGTNSLLGQTIYWSAILNPINLVSDVTGQGGFLEAPTDDFLQCSSYLRDQFVVFFTNTTWTFRYTGSDFAPFRWDKINSSKSTNAPYAAIDYDERITSIGYKGLIASDGVNVQRYDLNIIDQFMKIDQAWVGQCFGIRFDNINQSWMLYPSLGNQMSTNALVYNFLETTWSIFDMPMSCLGLYFETKDITWAECVAGAKPVSNWESANSVSWDTYLAQSRMPTLLGGGQDGVVYQLNIGDTDNGAPITADIISTRWNPFVGAGQKVQFGYIDFYYQAFPTGEAPVMDIQFYVNNSTSPAATRTLTMDGLIENDYAMKRIYINSIGEFLRMEMTSNSDSPFKIIGLVLWARPAGRLTP